MKTQRNVWWHCLVIAVSMLVLWPLFKRGFYVSDDGEWMVIRLSAFYQSLAEGQFPVRFLGRLNYSYGYPVANFLYPGFLYIGSILRLLGFSFVGAVKIILASSVIGAALFLFASLRRSFSRASSFVGTFSFLTAPYLAFDIYTRGSVGEILAFAAAAMTMWTIEGGFLLIFPLSIAFLIVSHNSLALLFVMFFTLYLTLSRRWVWFGYLVLGAGLSAFFWIPALLERDLVKFSLLTISQPRQYFLTLNNLTLVGLPFIVGLIVYLLSRRRKYFSSRGIYTGGFFIGLFLASPWSEVLWDMDIFLTLFQFPFRMLALVLLSGPWLVASSVEYLKSSRNKLVGVYVILGVVSLVPILGSVAYVDRPEGYYTTNEATTTVKDEYMPRWVGAMSSERNSNRIEIFQGRGTIEQRIVNTQRVDVDLTLEENSIIALNTIYYPGWGVTVDGHPAPLDWRNDRGLMRVAVPKGSHHFVAEFRETPERFVADSVTLASIILYSVFVVRRRLTRKRTI